MQLGPKHPISQHAAQLNKLIPSVMIFDPLRYGPIHYEIINLDIYRLIYS